MPRLQRAHKMESRRMQDRRMRKYLEIINHRTFIIVALCVLSVYMCLRLDYAYNVDWIFLSIAVLFPLVFTIREAFRRRQLAIRVLSALKAAISAFYFGLENNIKMPLDEKRQIHALMRALSGPEGRVRLAAIGFVALYIVNGVASNFAVFVPAGVHLTRLPAPILPRNDRLPLVRDDLPEFAGQNTTTEFLARHIYTQLRARILDGALLESGRTLDGLKITLHESHIAWASFEGPVAA